DKDLVGFDGEVGSPMLSARYADREVFQKGQRHRIDHISRLEWDLSLEPGLGVLRYELYAGCARIEGKHSVGLHGPRLGELGGEVELIGPARVFLADEVALVVHLDAGEHILAGRIVRRHQER